jgi:hypothetical protein
VIGTGCEEVSYTSLADGPVATGRWPGGRTGSIHVAKDWGVTVIRDQERKVVAVRPDYRTLLEQAVKFFETSEAPVSNQETLETLAFLAAAERSKSTGGAAVKLH